MRLMLMPGARNLRIVTTTLRGRVAYDARFELLSKKQLKSVFIWRNELGDGWRSAAGGARLIVLDSHTESKTEHALLRQKGTRRLYHDRNVSIVLRPTRASA